MQKQNARVLLPSRAVDPVYADVFRQGECRVTANWRFWVSGFGFWDFRFWVLGFGFRVSGFCWWPPHGTSFVFCGLSLLGFGSGVLVDLEPIPACFGERQPFSFEQLVMFLHTNVSWRQCATPPSPMLSPCSRSSFSSLSTPTKVAALSRRSLAQDCMDVVPVKQHLSARKECSESLHGGTVKPSLTTWDKGLDARDVSPKDPARQRKSVMIG